MRLFESRSEREAREKIAIQMGRKTIRDYLRNCHSTNLKYRDMAKKALALGQRNQAEHYVATHIQYRNQSAKWEAFLLKIDDVMLRGGAMNAMSGLMNGLSSLCRSISRGLSAKDIQRTMAGLQEGMIKVDQAETQIGTMIDGLAFNVGPDSFETSFEDLPVELKDQVHSVCNSLMDEVKVDESTAPRNGSHNRLSASETGGNSVQDRVDTQMERLRALRNNGKPGNF